VEPAPLAIQDMPLMALSAQKPTSPTTEIPSANNFSRELMSALSAVLGTLSTDSGYARKSILCATPTIRLLEIVKVATLVST
jgi:hypothetical protein